MPWDKPKGSLTPVRTVEWDEKKRLLIMRERRIDFIDAAKILFD
jgi:hypothetical protein